MNSVQRESHYYYQMLSPSFTMTIDSMLWAVSFQGRHAKLPFPDSSNSRSYSHACMASARRGVCDWLIERGRPNVNYYWLLTPHTGLYFIPWDNWRQNRTHWQALCCISGWSLSHHWHSFNIRNLRPSAIWFNSKLFNRHQPEGGTPFRVCTHFTIKLKRIKHQADGEPYKVWNLCDLQSGLQCLKLEARIPTRMSPLQGELSR